MEQKPESYWKKKLTPSQFKVLREANTEMPGTGNLLHNKETGIYTCAGCGSELFSSATKFDSGSGWPSFYDALENNIELHEDTSEGMQRIEVRCRTCGGHLGHLFDDGPLPSGQRYCINSAALQFKQTIDPSPLKKKRAGLSSRKKRRS